MKLCEGAILQVMEECGAVGAVTVYYIVLPLADASVVIISEPFPLCVEISASS